MSKRTTEKAQEFARALVDLYEDAGFDGIADEMSWAQIETGNKFCAVVEDAKRYLSTPPGGTSD